MKQSEADSKVTLTFCQQFCRPRRDFRCCIFRNDSTGGIQQALPNGCLCSAAARWSVITMTTYRYSMCMIVRAPDDPDCVCMAQSWASLPGRGARNTWIHSTAEVSVDSVEKENEAESTEQPPSPASTTSQESKLQKLKRSLSFKTKSLRSKSADNFFQRTNSDVKLQVDLMPEVSTSTGQLPNSDSQASSPTRAQQLPENSKTHIFQEHIFKKPTFCDVCNHMIVGTNAKHGLRCKACKMSIHHKCADSIGQQRCMGKLPKGFRRYYSSPLLIHEQFGCIKEVMPIACGNKVDPVYETLRFGTSLAQKTKKGSSGSGSDSPNRNSVV